MAKKKVNSPMVVRTCKLFLTITFQPRVHKRTSILQLKRTIAITQELLRTIKFEGDCFVEGTKTANVHYHALGILELPSNKKDASGYINNIAKNIDSEDFGYVDVQNPKNEDLVQTYISKDRERSLELFGRHQIWMMSEPLSEMEDRYDVDTIESESE